MTKSQRMREAARRAILERCGEPDLAEEPVHLARRAANMASGENL